jgi:GMP synthase (glutamine-hydrolysing)
LSNNKITVGILNADELALEVENKFGNYSDMFQQLFQNSPFVFKSYQVTQEIYPTDINECNAYLITGSKFSAYENITWIIKLKEFIKELHRQNKKLIGICFGHQIIAEALGGQVTKSSHGWGVGLMDSKIICNKAWMEPKIPSYALLVSHQDQVEKLPEHAICIASNHFCLNSSFQLNENILTFQGHPEFSKEYLLQIMNKRRKAIGEETYRSALSSLDNKVDTSMIISWIENFIR